MCYVLSEGKYRYHAVKEPYPTEIAFDADLGYVDVESVVVQNEYIFVKARYFLCTCFVRVVTHLENLEKWWDFKVVGENDKSFRQVKEN